MNWWGVISLENARILDERLKKIVQDISGKTGDNIKQNLLQELEDRFSKIIVELSEKKLTDLLLSVKKNLDDL